MSETPADNGPGDAWHLATVLVPRRNDVARMELLFGRWPGTPRPLPPGVERPWSWLKYVRPDQIAGVPELRPWLQHFPDLAERHRTSEDDPSTELMRDVLGRCHVTSLAYGFPPTAPLDPGEERDGALLDGALRRALQQAVATQRATSGSLLSERWLVDSPIGRALEEHVGVLGALRRGGSLRAHSPSLVVGLLARGGVCLDSLPPPGLEEVVAALFRCEGWYVELTPATRDGGKDLIATRDDSDGRVVVYVEVKHPRVRGRVPVSAVREFVAVLGGDGITRGYLVTSGTFTPDALRWAREKGRNIALLEPVDRHALLRRLYAAAREVRGILPHLGEGTARQPRRGPGAPRERG